MIESPLIKELVVERSHELILLTLDARFGAVPEQVSAALKKVEDVRQLDVLARWAAICPDLDAFRARL
jgi:hypothetical protein